MTRTETMLAIACAILLGLAATGFAGWRVYVAAHAAPPGHVAIVWDRSGTRAVGCDAMAALAADIQTRVPAGSEVALLVTGQTVSQNRAQLVESTKVPEVRVVSNGRQRRQRAAADFSSALEQACRSISITDESPIIDAVGDALSLVRARNCAGTACVVYIVTDGEESASADFRSALRGSTRALARIRGTLHNESVSVLLCGLAQTGSTAAGPGPRARSIDVLERSWKAVFSVEEAVVVSRYCTSG